MLQETRLHHQVSNILPTDGVIIGFDFHFIPFDDNQGTFAVALSRNIARMAELVRSSAISESQYASGLITVNICVDDDGDKPISNLWSCSRCLEGYQGERCEEKLVVRKGKPYKTNLQTKI